MFSIRLPTHPTMRLLELAAILFLSVSMTIPVMALGPLDEPAPAAQILTIIRNGKIEAEAPSDQVTITRASSNCGGTDLIAKKGLPLCKGDRVKTSAGWVVKIVFGDPMLGNEFTLLQPSEITIGSIDCGRICRWLASLASPITNNVPHKVLVNKGTVYEVETRPDTSSTVTVYEGEVEISEPAPSPAEGPSPTSTESPSPGPIAPTSSPTPFTVPRLFRATIHIDGTIDQTKMSDGDVQAELVYSSDAEINAHQRPAEAGGGVAEFPNFPDDSTRNPQFKLARLNSFLHPDQPLPLETMGRVYNDWGDTPKAIELLEKASTLGPGLPAWQASEELLINKAIAYRRAGRFGDAHRQVTAALSVPERHQLDKTLNVRGSIYYYEARQALKNDRTADAKQLLQKAQQDFGEAAADSNPQQQQYAQVNLGQTRKTLGDILEREGSLEAEQSYTDAIVALEDAYGRTRNQQNRVAGLLVGRASVALANHFSALNNPEAANRSYLRAETAYKNSIRDAPGDSEGYCGLASLYQILGKKPEADENYQKCVSFNPTALVAQVEVPDLTNRTRAAAIQILAEAGLGADFESATDGDVVESQAPAAGQTSKVGEKVKIRVKFLLRDRE